MVHPVPAARGHSPTSAGPVVRTNFQLGRLGEASPTPLPPRHVLPRIPGEHCPPRRPGVGSGKTASSRALGVEANPAAPYRRLLMEHPFLLRHDFAPS